MPEHNGVHFPDLKPLDQAVLFDAPGHCHFYHYEPDNGTRYEVMISRRNRTDHKYDAYYPLLTVAVMNFDRPCSMTIPFPDAPLGVHNIDYMMDKMGILNGDAWALLPLINRFITLAKVAEDAGLI